MNRAWRAALLALGLCLVTGHPLARAANVTVFAAASLKNALDEVDAAYAKRAGRTSVISYAASSALARQIENGAPADIAIFADLDWMNYLEQRRLLKAGTRTRLLGNELVLIAPARSTARIEIAAHFPLAAQLGGGRLAIADPDHVPAGKYAKAALETLGVWRSVAGRTARAENVRAALTFVSRGEAPLGIVYRTDAAADAKVRVVAAFPAGVHPPIVYPAALLARSRSAAAMQYFEFLKTRGALAIFERHGFVAAGPR